MLQFGIRSREQSHSSNPFWYRLAGSSRHQLFEPIKSIQIVEKYWRGLFLYDALVFHRPPTVRTARLAFCVSNSKPERKRDFSSLGTILTQLISPLSKMKLTRDSFGSKTKEVSVGDCQAGQSSARAKKQQRTASQ